MTTSSETKLKRPPAAKKTTAEAAATKSKSTSASRKRSKKSLTSVAIATELAPAVAIALLDKTEHAPGDPMPALEYLAAAATPSDISGMVRVQLLFENGSVLPVEMSTEAGVALSKGLSAELPQK